MKDGASLVSEDFFPLFRGVVSSIINERGGVVVNPSDSSVAGELRPARRLSGRQRLVIAR